MTSRERRLVVVTRHESATGPLSTALRAANLEPVVAPGFKYVPAHPPLDTSTWHRYTWAAWTSVAAVEAVLDSAGSLPPTDPARALRHVVVGGATANALRAVRLEPEIVGEGGSADLAELLLARLDPSDRLVYPRSGRADASFAERLRSFGVEVDDPVAYGIGPADPELIRATLMRRPGAVVFASPSAVAGFADALASSVQSTESQGGAAVLDDLIMASIGPTTSAALRNRLREPDVTAATPSFEDLARAVAAQLDPEENRSARSSQ